MNPTILIRPRPSAADRAEAERFVDERLGHQCPTYLANNRENLPRCAADAAMQKRMHQEWRQQFADPAIISDSAAFTPKAEPAVSADDWACLGLFAFLFCAIALFAGV